MVVQGWIHCNKLTKAFHPAKSFRQRSLIPPSKDRKSVLDPPLDILRFTKREIYHFCESESRCCLDSQRYTSLRRRGNLEISRVRYRILTIFKPSIAELVAAKQHACKRDTPYRDCTFARSLLWTVAVAHEAHFAVAQSSRKQAWVRSALALRAPVPSRLRSIRILLLTCLML